MNDSNLKDRIMMWLSNRYAKLLLLTLAMTAMFTLLLFLLFELIGLHDFPFAFIVMLSVLGSGMLVYKYVAPRVF
ncbi:hypothetical protein B7Z28_00120 [Candidatus Saccharibacteria bacterium 32-45-3]|nr:MAG: hypothetical protein B7Z28_00120 [Candidatus Saccharibacteria bacterium 32-45-3]